MKKLNLQDILDNTSELKEKKIWYIAVIGRPNTGKSTFLNTLIGQKISITTNVPQTTRKKILAIYNDEESQIIFFDTPWIHKSEKSFNEEINAQAISSLKDSDKVIYFIDSSRKWWEEERYIESILENISTPIIKVYTKADLKPEIVIPDNSHMISSNTKQWFSQLLTEIKKDLKEDITPFPEDHYTSQGMHFRIWEIVREKLFNHTKEELPHSTFIWVEEIEDKPNILKIVAYIYTETESQKYIVIWKWWSLVSLIWKEARIELEEIFDKKVFLALRVKSKKWWRKDEKLVKKILS